MVFVKPKGLLQNGDDNHIYRQPLAYLNRYDWADSNRQILDMSVWMRTKSPSFLS